MVPSLVEDRNTDAIMSQIVKVDDTIEDAK